MPSRSTRTPEELHEANKETVRGGIVGAAKWALIGGGIALAGFWISPIYRNLTIQFKIYIQMSFMTFGGMLEADRYVRAFERRTRLQRKQKKDEAVWDEWASLLREEERLEKSKRERQQDEA